MHTQLNSIAHDQNDSKSFEHTTVLGTDHVQGFMTLRLKMMS